MLSRDDRRCVAGCRENQSAASSRGCAIGAPRDRRSPERLLLARFVLPVPTRKTGPSTLTAVRRTKTPTKWSGRTKPGSFPGSPFARTADLFTGLTPRPNKKSVLGTAGTHSSMQLTLSPKRLSVNKNLYENDKYFQNKELHHQYNAPRTRLPQAGRIVILVNINPATSYRN
jgi:hypothetical protein